MVRLGSYNMHFYYSCVISRECIYHIITTYIYQNLFFTDHIAVYYIGGTYTECSHRRFVIVSTKLRIVYLQHNREIRKEEYTSIKVGSMSLFFKTFYDIRRYLDKA